MTRRDRVNQQIEARGFATAADRRELFEAQYEEVEAKIAADRAAFRKPFDDLLIGFVDAFEKIPGVRWASESVLHLLLVWWAILALGAIAILLGHH